ncbi:GFA family protein [Pelagibacterium limicola]|uniref:GFA family protein n=1 Tax=Pelagibacterium limicola TaxID=2791022 RepID=UPI0018AFE412|nr:DUF6151 family protein [Pelagibacterium limicola]
MKTARLACTCGKVRLEVRGAPIITTECHCNSCRAAGDHFEALGAPDFRSPNGGTPFVMMRKDRVDVVAGSEHLKAIRLGTGSTRRFITTCCNTPVFLEFKGGHWLSLYKSVWPVGTMPAVELRTMTSDLPDPGVLDGTVQIGKRQTWGFFAKLLGAWIAMGFRSPRVEVQEEVILR